MEEYISKSALVAKIERKINEVNFDNIEDWHYRLLRERDIEVMKNILSLINTLEVKKVDLDKSLTGFMGRYAYENGGELPSAIDIAKHFFELGMLVNNPITAADRGMVDEIIINLKRVENDYRINLTKEIKWVRNKVKKGK